MLHAASCMRLLLAALLCGVTHTDATAAPPQPTPAPGPASPPATPIRVYHADTLTPPVEWVTEFLLDMNPIEGTVVLTLKGPSSAWFAVGFGVKAGASGAATMDGVYSIVVSRAVTEAYTLTAQGIEPGNRLANELDTLDDVTIGEWRRVTLSRRISTPTFDFSQYLVPGRTVEMVSATGLYATGDKRQYGNHLGGARRLSATVRVVQQEGLDCYHKDGNETACNIAGCWWLRGACRDCIDAGEDSCKNAVGCQYNQNSHKCEALCHTERHRSDFGYCVPEHWDVNKKDTFTWFEKTCTVHISAETKLELRNFLQVQLNQHHLIPEELQHLVESPAETHHDDDHGTPYNILVIFGTFAIGTVVRHFCLAFPQVPYTVVIFLVGSVFGVLGKWNATKDNFAKYESLAYMNPHMIFYVFLPVLIFESAFAMEIPVFKKVVGQCLILAGPGLMVASLATGMVAKYVFVEYEWTLPACLLFGTIMSATDPVAVVALLKELGASPVISTMIEGESLFNDGTAIVFFSVLKSSVEKGADGGCTSLWESCGDQCSCLADCEIPLSLIEILIEFSKVSFGGPAVGLVMGVITVESISRVFNDPLIEITLTICSAYVTFYMCEAFFHVSGVLGLVVLGCYMSYFKECISPEVEHSLHEFWHMTVYLTNTCIFALAGMIVALKAFDNITLVDLYYLGVVYVTINVVRILVLLLFTPALYLFKYKLSVGESALVAWGGLRGAVGLALALIIQADENVVVANVRDKFIVHVAGVVILTLVVNGVSTQKLVAFFKLDAIEERKKKLMRDRFADLQAYRKAEIQNLGWDEATATAYYDCDWSKVYTLTDPATELSDGYVNPYMKQGERLFNSSDPDYRAKSWEEGRTVYFGAIMSAIHQHYAAGVINPSAVRQLHRLTLEAQEAEGVQGLGDYPTEAGLMDPAQLQGLFEQDTYLKKRFWGKHLVKALNVSLTFVSAHEIAQRRVKLVCDPNASSRIATLCKRNISQMNEIINQNTKQYPTVSCALKTKHASRNILNKMKQIINTMLHEGRLDDQDRAALITVVEGRMKNLQKKFPATLRYPVADACELMPFYHHCDDAAKRIVEDLCQGKVVSVNAKTELLAQPKGENKRQTGGVFLIVTGIVSLRVGRKLFRYGSGYALGLQQFLTQSTRFDAIETESSCLMVHITSAALSEAASRSDSLSLALWRQCGMQAARLLMPLSPAFERWSDTKIRKVAETGEVAILQDPQQVPFDHERRQKLPSDTAYTVVLRGRCYEYEGQLAIKFPEMIPQTYKFATFTNHAVIFEMEAPDNASRRARRRWGRLRSKTRSIVLWSSLRGRYWGRVSLALALHAPLPSDVDGPLPEELSRQKQAEQGDAGEAFASPTRMKSKRNGFSSPKKGRKKQNSFEELLARNDEDSGLGAAALPPRIGSSARTGSYGDPMTLRKNRMKREQQGRQQKLPDSLAGNGSFGPFDYGVYGKLTPSSDDSPTGTEALELAVFPRSSPNVHTVEAPRLGSRPSSRQIHPPPPSVARMSMESAAVRGPSRGATSRRPGKQPSPLVNQGNPPSYPYRKNDPPTRANASRTSLHMVPATHVRLPEAPDFAKLLDTVDGGR